MHWKNFVSTEQREVNSTENNGGWSSTSVLGKFLVFWNFKYILICISVWMEAPMLQNYDCLVINSELYQIEFCECWGTQNSISMVSFQWKGESKFGISPWFNWCLRFSAALIWREHFQGWTSKLFHFSFELYLLLMEYVLLVEDADAITGFW